jgi:CTP:molybdopterin cytidylyltransferase MocA
MSGARAVDGVLLAAGRSRRMGSPKALLQVDGETLLERGIRVLHEGGCRHVVVVVHDAEPWTGRLAGLPAVTVVINPDEHSEQVDSLRLGLSRIPADSAAVLVLPVDVPGVRADTVRRVLRRFLDDGPAIVLPRHDGQTGHPVLLSRSLFAELVANDLADGVRSMLTAHAADTALVEVDDAGILIDLDTPAHYRAYLDGVDP